MTEADWTDLKVEYLDRAQPKYKLVDLDEAKWKCAVLSDEVKYYNEAIDDIKSKYGDLYVVIRK